MNKIVVNLQEYSAIWYHDSDIMNIYDIGSIDIIQDKPCTLYAIGAVIPMLTQSLGRQLHIITPILDLKILADIEIQTANENISYEQYAYADGLKIGTIKRQIEL